MAPRQSHVPAGYARALRMPQFEPLRQRRVDTPSRWLPQEEAPSLQPGGAIPYLLPARPRPYRRVPASVAGGSVQAFCLASASYDLFASIRPHIFQIRILAFVSPKAAARYCPSGDHAIAVTGSLMPPVSRVLVGNDPSTNFQKETLPFGLPLAKPVLL